MKSKNQKMLPKTIKEIPNGGVYSQSIRCGKTNCKCARGETHSAYYFFTRRNGKLVKFYIRKSEFEEFSRLVSVAAKERKENRKTIKADTELLKKLRQMLCERDALIKLLKGSNDYD